MNGLLFLVDVAGETLQRSVANLQSQLAQAGEEVEKLTGQVATQRTSLAETTSIRVERDRLAAELAQLRSGVAPAEVLAALTDGEGPADPKANGANGTAKAKPARST